MSVDSICDKILAKSWKTMDSRPRKGTEGIYVIGKSILQRLAQMTQLSEFFMPKCLLVHYDILAKV